MISRVGVGLVGIVCCLRRILHGRGVCILVIALTARYLVVVGIGFSTFVLRHFLRPRGKEMMVFKSWKKCEVALHCIS